MKFLIGDQLVKGYELGEKYAVLSENILISEMVLNTASYGVFYKEGMLNVKNISTQLTEAYVDDAGILNIYDKNIVVWSSYGAD